jgi:branched-chain amino acid transport system substrate-binding protein
MICKIKISSIFRDRFLIAVLSIFLIISCAAQRMVMRKGVLMKEEEAATLDFSAAEKLFKAKKLKDAAINFELIAVNYPKVGISADALFRAAEIHETLKDSKKAISNLEKLIINYPFSHLIDSSRVRLGGLYLRAGKYQETRDVLSPVDLKSYDRKEQTRILLDLREALKMLENWGELAFCDIKIYDSTTELSLLSLIKAEILELVESKLDPDTLMKISESRKSLYPGDLAIFKLSKIAYHIRDFKNARNYLAYFLREYPISEYYREGQDLYDRLTKRKSPDPKSIGLLLPLSGPNSFIGELALKGVMLATHLFQKAKGPFDDFKIIIRDTEGNADLTARRFDELVLEGGVIGIIGPMLARPSEIAALKAQEYGVPVILLNQNEGITEIGDYVFRNFITKSTQTKALAKFAVENLKIKRFAFLYPRHSFGIDFMNSFWDEIAAYPDVSVRGAESYDSSANDFSEPIKKLVGLDNLSFRENEICTKEEMDRRLSKGEEGGQCYEAEDLPPIIDFEALVIPDNSEKIVQIAPALLFHKVKAIQLLGSNLWNSENIFKENTGKYLQGAIFTDSYFKKSTNPRLGAFAKDYSAEFGDEPDLISVHAYEAASVMLEAITRSNPSDSDALRNAMASGSFTNTLQGGASFSADRNLLHNLTFIIVDGNEFKELY